MGSRMYDLLVCGSLVYVTGEERVKWEIYEEFIPAMAFDLVNFGDRLEELSQHYTRSIINSNIVLEDPEWILDIVRKTIQALQEAKDHSKKGEVTVKVEKISPSVISPKIVPEVSFRKIQPLFAGLSDDESA